MTAEHIASYEYSVDGWTWAIRLFPTELSVMGVKGDEHQVQAVELRHCAEVPDSGVREHVEWTPPRFWIALAAIMVATALLFVVAGIGDEEKSAEVAKLAVFVMLIELVLVPPSLSQMLKKRRLQRYLTFKSVVDGKPLFAVYSALDADETFEGFVAEIVSLIRSNKWQFKEH